MPRVGRGRRESKVPIERDGPVVFRMNGECTNADHIGDLERAPERIKQQPGTNAAALHRCVDGEAREPPAAVSDGAPCP